MEKTYRKVTAFLGSRTFFWLIIVLFVLQALWVAFSFRYPQIYDEKYHLGIIKVFSNHLYSPIITHQAPEYDQYRDLVHEGSTLFHYILAFPYKIISTITQSSIAQIIFLRVINIGLFASGLYFFSKLFRRIKIRQIYINVTLFFLILLPMVSQISSTINYDNMLFPLSAIFFIFCVNIVLSKKINWQDYAGVLVSGAAASLVKSELLPLYAVGVVYIAILSWLRYNKKSIKKIKESFVNTSRHTQVIWIALLIVFGLMFTRLYIVNVIEYGTPKPSCVTTLNENRCEKNDVISGYNKLKESKNTRNTALPNDYFLSWISHLEIFSNRTGAVSSKNGSAVFSKGLPIVYIITFISGVSGVMVLAYAWRSMHKNSSYYLLVTFAITLISALFLVNMKAYYKYNLPVAIQSRYLLPILPIIMVFIVLAVSFTLDKIRYAKLAAFILVAGVFVLGGAGVSTHILQSSDTWYWQRQKVIKANHTAKKILAPIIKESLRP